VSFVIQTPVPTSDHPTKDHPTKDHLTKDHLTKDHPTNLPRHFEQEPLPTPSFRASEASREISPPHVHM
jgi:hypothetical protein